MAATEKNRRAFLGELQLHQYCNEAYSDGEHEGERHTLQPLDNLANRQIACSIYSDSYFSVGSSQDGKII